MNKKKTLLISLGILLVGGALTALIFLTEPTAERSGATKESAMLVEVSEVERGDYQPTIVVTGTVQPSQEIILSPRVGGQVIDLYEGFTPGGFVKEGELLLQIDPADYRNQLALRQSDLQQAIAQLNIEQGRQDVARKGYELVDEELGEMNEDLVLREPQLNSVKARVNAARAAVEQARLNLQRTSIRAPFDAHILSRSVNEGSQVAAGNDLARLVGMEEYWVVANVPLSILKWLTFSDKGDTLGSPVKIYNRKAWKDDTYRKGYLYQLIGSLEEQTRLARVLVSVPDPLAYQNDSLPSLIINSFVEANIEAEMLEDVIRLNRDYVREGETVWTMENGKLQIKEVDIIVEDAQYAYIRSGIEDDDKVVKTNLATVTEGAELKTEDSARQEEKNPEDASQTENVSKSRAGGGN
ncbi:MAG: efflux RND transporter periplasmic adaptor subunit [Cyclobacteriaceae bacterium]